MERFCDKCGSLVSGDGGFCPSCGASMGSVGGVDLSKNSSMPSTSDIPTPTGSSYQTQQNYTQPNYQQTNYSQPIYRQPVYAQNQEMTVGQWILTIFLSVLGIIGIILLFVWGFSADTPQPKKNYARAMLIIKAVVFVLSFLFIPLLSIFLIGIVDGIADGYMGYEYTASLFMSLLGR